MEKSKTHYRKVFKSDHLGVADIEDLIENKSNLIFTIREVRQEIGVRVAGQKGNYNIAYFKENIKPWVLNAGSCAIMKNFSGGSKFVEDWANTTVQLYIDPTARFGGEVTGGVRINPNPVKQRQELTPQSNAWPNAVNAYKRDGNLNAVLEHMDISEANQKLIKEQANVA
jgi:hypothetical protein